jgi:hypothetical protein
MRSFDLRPSVVMVAFVIVTAGCCSLGNANAPAPSTVDVRPTSDDAQREYRTRQLSLVGAGLDEAARSAVRVAELSLRVLDRRTAETALGREVNALGGHILASQAVNSSCLQVTFCVANAKFDDAMAAALGLADGIIARRIRSLDEELADLATHIRDRDAVRIRWLTFLEHPVTAQDARAAQVTLVDLQGQLDQLIRRAQLLRESGASSTFIVLLVPSPL